MHTVLILLLMRKFFRNFVSTIIVYYCHYSTITDFQTSVHADIIDNKEDRQRAYDVTLRRFSVTTVAVGKRDKYYIF